MRIFIDESGSFVRGERVSGLSLVGALVIPDERIAQISKKYEAIRSRLPKKDGEVKGRLLDEAQVAEVVHLLSRNEVLLELVAVDLNAHESADIVQHKQAQAKGMTSRLTEADQPWLAVALDIAARIAMLPHQLYVQSVAMFELVWQVIEHSINYYAQRRPKELAAFHWTMDGKDKGRQTNWEQLWASIVLPMLESKSTEMPMRYFSGGDYRYLAPFFSIAPNTLPKPEGADGSATNIQKLVMDSFKYSSCAETGLELVDIVVGAARRGLIGNLHPCGWIGIPALMIHREQQYISFIALHDRALSTDAPYFGPLMNGFTSNGRSMMAPRFLEP